MNNYSVQNANAYVAYRCEVLSAHTVNVQKKDKKHGKRSRK